MSKTEDEARSSNAEAIRRKNARLEARAAEMERLDREEALRLQQRAEERRLTATPPPTPK